MPGTNDDVTIEETRLEPGDWDEAVSLTRGPQLVVAGPGAGKTEFLVRRTAHLVAAGVDPRQIAVLTFSRRGAADLADRIAEALGRGRPSPRASTFHSLAARLLEAHGTAIHGWAQPPALLTGPEQVALVADLLHREDPADWPTGFRGLLGSRSFAEEVTDFLLRSQEHRMTPGDLAAAAAGRSDWAALPGFSTRYHDELTRLHRMDYAGLIVAATEAAADPAVAATLEDDVSHVLVDEYQDTTPAQVAFLRALVPSGGNLTVAADPYQSIYSFRGADLGNVERFPGAFPDAAGRPARRWVLTTSFRVPAGILRPAERLTAGSLPGSAGPVTPAGPGGRVDVHVFDQHSHEADWIAGEVHRLHLAERIPLGRMAVLVRSTRRFLPDLSRALDRRGLPHDRPDTRLVDHPAIRTVADLVDLAVADHLDRPESEQLRTARRLLLGPLLGLPLGAERETVRERLRSTAPWHELLGALPRGDGLGDLLGDPAWAVDIPAADGFWHLWSSVPALGRLALREPDWRAALTSFSQVLERQAERDPGMSLAGMLTRIDDDDFEAQPLLRFDAADEDRLVVTTLHQAKGLEFDVAFVADAVDGVLPDLRRAVSILNTHLLPASRRDPVEAARFRLQEEMRLAYTAMTRASERVVWTATAAGQDETEDRPSRFLDAIAPETDRMPPRHAERAPVTALEAEALLRRTLTDPGRPAADRLAALRSLTDPSLPHLRPPLMLPGVRARGPSEGLVPDDAGFSPSQAMSFETCPRRYALERHLGIGDEPSVYMAFGSLVHAAAERADRAAIAMGRDGATSQDALTALAEVFDPADFGGRPWSDHWFRRAEHALTRLYDAAPPGTWQVAFVERPLELSIDGERWRGRADRIDHRDDEVRIVDYKTGTNAPKVAEAAEGLQLGFYVLAAEADPDVAALGTIAAAELWYPQVAAKHVTTRSFDLANREAVRARLAAIAADIRAERFPAVVNARCDRCPVRILCDEWPDGREAFVP